MKTLKVILAFSALTFVSASFADSPAGPQPGQTSTTSDGHGGTWTCTSGSGGGNCVHHPGTSTGSN